jgi:diguanylate cyclase (GGDEF)-like protein
MKVVLTSFKNTIAKKFFILFLLSALFPLTIFSYYAVYQIEEIISNSIKIELQNDSKSYAASLNERLNLFKFLLSHYEASIKQGNKISHWEVQKEKKRLFSSLSLLENNTTETIFWGTPPELNNLTANEQYLLHSGETLLLLVADSSLQFPRVVMVKQLTDKDKKAYLVGGIKVNELWGSEDSFDLRKTFCIINHQEIILFCSQSEIQAAMPSIISQASLQSRGKLSLSYNNQPIYVGYSSLFLKYNFFLEDWKIIFAQPKQESIYNKMFGTFFYSISAFTLIFVVYLSFITIRKQMRPLDALMKGITRINNNNFKEQVPIISHDEFGKLSFEFNKMSERINDQLTFLTTLSEIDHLILGRISKSEIIKLVISRANNIIHSDQVSLSLLSDAKSLEVIMYLADKSQSKGISQQIYSICSDTRQALFSNKIIEIHQPQTPYIDSVAPLSKNNYTYHLIFPIYHKENTPAFLIYSFYQKPEISRDNLKWGQDFSDRIAVAITNATWEKQLYHQAHYDSLTGLPNRLLFMDRLQHAIDQAERENETPVILFLDLDKFKNVNDSLGHIAGDKLLQIISKRITSCLRKGDTVARLGGDEFVVLFEGYCGDCASKLLKVLKKILLEVSKPVLLNENTFRVTTSIGVAIYPQDGNNTELLLKNADTALYEAKKQGKSRYQFYSKELNAGILKELLLESDLHRAYESEQFELYYQPKIEIKTGLIVGVEVLLRWRHHDQGMISPAVFIPMIEQSGLIISVGNWVMRKAFEQYRLWQIQGVDNLSLSINLSSIQFNHKDLYKDIEKLSNEYNIDMSFIDIEITESTAMKDVMQTLKILKKIKSLGISISIDDYGTGYSSLEYLKDFPIDTLKIDRTFIINLEHSDKEKAIVRSTISLAHELGLNIVAEGVENNHQYNLLKNMDCDQIQGFYFSKPLPATEFEQLLHSETKFL